MAEKINFNPQVINSVQLKNQRMFEIQLAARFRHVPYTRRNEWVARKGRSKRKVVSQRRILLTHFTSNMKQDISAAIFAPLSLPLTSWVFRKLSLSLPLLLFLSVLPLLLFSLGARLCPSSQIAFLQPCAENLLHKCRCKLREGVNKNHSWEREEKERGNPFI